MPNDGDTKPCTHPHCDGTMTYHATARTEQGTGTGNQRGNINWAERRAPPGWYCDKAMQHDEPL